MNRLTEAPDRPRVRPRAVESRAFEVVCSEVHPMHCEQSLSASSQEGLVELAADHGALVHGFTPAWYSQARKAAMAAAVAHKHR